MHINIDGLCLIKTREMEIEVRVMVNPSRTASDPITDEVINHVSIIVVG
jgi:hypothetical protein